ncbi:MAG: 16S rRNA (cytosine(967)-C(5))-methyltransferase RsmB [Oscillospiraceae bacterium]
MTARQTALLVLERCRRSGAWSDALLDSMIVSAKLECRDAALVSRLCYGVLQNTTYCDFCIDAYSTIKTAKIEPKVLDILRLSVYQLLYMDRIPAHAVVNEAVTLCKTSGLSRASGFVNAVLRRVAEHKEQLPEVPRTDPAVYLSIRYSHPLWLAREMLALYGLEFAKAYFAANNVPVPMIAQVNTLRTDIGILQQKLAESSVQAERVDWLPDCLALSRSGDLTQLPAFVDGDFYIQDPAAKLAIIAADPKKGMQVLDACAAPGGKSFAAAIQMENCGRIRACDLHEKKCKRIREGAERLGISIIETAQMDAREPDDRLGQFDLVIADVPCSGLGVIRKKPDIRYKKESELAGLPDIQLDILKGLANCVAAGGVLLYSTCTVRQCENEVVVQAFLAQHPEFKLEPFVLPEPVGACNGMVTLWPHLHGTDGFFICKLRKQV